MKTLNDAEVAAVGGGAISEEVWRDRQALDRMWRELLDRPPLGEKPDFGVDP